MKWLKMDEMAKYGTLMTGFTLIGGFFDYLYQLYMAIKLTPQDYGILFSLNSILMIILVFAQSIQITNSKFVARFIKANDIAYIYSFWRISLKKTTILGLILFLIACLISPFLAGFLRIDVWYLIIIFSSFVFATALSVNWGTLQGMQKFVFLGFSHLSWSFLKFALGIILVYLWFNLYSAILPLAINTIIVFLSTIYYLRFLNKSGSKNVDIRGYSAYTGFALISVIAYALLTNIDVVLAKHYLNAEEAGYYSAISVLGRIVLYIGSGIVIAMFPKVSGLFEKRIEHLHILRNSIILAIIFAGGAVLIFGLFPDFVTNLLFQGKYQNVATHLWKYGLAMFLYAVSYLIMNYFLAIDREKIACSIAGISLLQIILIVLCHSNINQIINIIAVQDKLKKLFWTG